MIDRQGFCGFLLVYSNFGEMAELGEVNFGEMAVWGVLNLRGCKKYVIFAQENSI